MKYSITFIALFFTTITFGQNNYQTIFETPQTVVMSPKGIFANKGEESQAVIPVLIPAGMSRLYFSSAFLPPTVGMGRYDALTTKLEKLPQNDINTVSTLMTQFTMPSGNKVKFNVYKGVLSAEVGTLKTKNISLLNLEKTTSFTNYVEVEEGETIYFVVENLERTKETKVIFEAVGWGE